MPQRFLAVVPFKGASVTKSKVAVSKCEGCAAPIGTKRRASSLSSYPPRSSYSRQRRLAPCRVCRSEIRDHMRIHVRRRCDERERQGVLHRSWSSIATFRG